MRTRDEGMQIGDLNCLANRAGQIRFIKFHRMIKHPILRPLSVKPLIAGAKYCDSKVTNGVLSND